MDAAEGTAPARERGWLGPIAALLLLVLMTTLPYTRVVVPASDVMLLLAPVTAACAVAGLRAGGRLPLALLWMAFAMWVVWGVRDTSGPHADLMREWALLLALSFGVVASTKLGDSFLPKALLAVAAALLLGFAVVLMSPGGLTGTIGVLTSEIGYRAAVASRELREIMATPLWFDATAWREAGEVGEQRFAWFVGNALVVFPAVLALQSVATLALGWSVYHRVGRARLGPPLAELRDLRFNDALVWGVVAGLALVAFPGSGVARDIGVNLLVFFGALHALRGIGVVIWFVAPGRAMTIVLVFLTAVLWQLVGLYVLVVSAGLGLGDTWFDWRRASRHRSQRSE